jgi:branched-chain amino acid transport system substrate-binding protein
MTILAHSWRIAAVATVALLWQAPLLAADTDPVRIGVITSLSGPYQAFGGEIKDGAQFAVDEANAEGGVDGRKVEVEFGDEQGNPDIGRREAGTLALKGYNLLLGGVSSAVSLAISGQTQRMDAIYMGTLSSADGLTGKDCNARTFRSYTSDAMNIAILKPWLKDQPEKHWAILAADYTWGHHSAEGFTAAAITNAKSVDPPMFAPFGATDFAPYITQLMRSGAEAVWVANSGSDLINFWKQAKQFGLMEKLKIVMPSGVSASVIEALGDQSEGMKGLLAYSSTESSAGNQAFVKAWRARFRKDPGFPSVEAYINVRAILGAVAKAHSVKPADVAGAMSGLALDTPMYGKVTIRPEDHQFTVPNYFGHVGRVNGELKPVIDQAFKAEDYMPPPSKECHMR